MNERQIKLVKDYGKKSFDRCTKILNEFNYLPSDALSVLTDEEWQKCGEMMIEFQNELYKVRKLIYYRMEEAGVKL